MAGEDACEKGARKDGSGQVGSRSDRPHGLAFGGGVLVRERGGDGGAERAAFLGEDVVGKRRWLGLGPA
jgi:hypothetical protein